MVSKAVAAVPGITAYKGLTNTRIHEVTTHPPVPSKARKIYLVNKSWWREVPSIIIHRRRMNTHASTTRPYTHPFPKKRASLYFVYFTFQKHLYRWIST